MDSYIRGEHMLMADSLTAEMYRQYCRDNTSLDFTKLEGSWVPHMEFNNYMQALRQKAGHIGPRIVGRQIGPTVEKLFGSLSKAGSVENMLHAWTNIYAENNKGKNSGKLGIEDLTNNSVYVITTSPLDEGFHLGVGEGFIRFYNKFIQTAELKESMITSSRTALYYEWR